MPIVLLLLIPLLLFKQLTLHILIIKSRQHDQSQRKHTDVFEMAKQIFVRNKHVVSKIHNLIAFLKKYIFASKIYKMLSQSSLCCLYFLSNDTSKSVLTFMEIQWQMYFAKKPA